MKENEDLKLKLLSLASILEIKEMEIKDKEDIIRDLKAEISELRKNFLTK